MVVMIEGVGGVGGVIVYITVGRTCMTHTQEEARKCRNVQILLHTDTLSYILLLLAMNELEDRTLETHLSEQK